MSDEFLWFWNREMRVELTGPGTGFLVWSHDLQGHSKKKKYQAVSTEDFLQVSTGILLSANWCFLMQNTLCLFYFITEFGFIFAWLCCFLLFP